MELKKKGIEYNMKISEAEFISKCMESNECTLEEFHEYYEVFPCNCEYENCEGWRNELKEDAVRKFYENSKKDQIK